MATLGSVNLSSLIIGLFVILWVSGFDIIYAILDIEFDRENKLYSLPARFGIKRSLQISLILHIIGGFFLIFLGIILKFGWVYLNGAIVSFYLLIRQHIIIKDITKVNEAFFTTNGIISILLFFVVIFSYL